MYRPFDSIPAEARVWIYQASRPFTPQESGFLMQELRGLCDQWSAHGQPLQTSFSIEHNQFVILAVDETHNGASGCSIDGSVRILKELERQSGLDFFDRKRIAFLSDESVILHPFASLPILFENKTLSGETITFDNTITLKEDWERGWKIPVKQSWLAHYLPKSAVAG